MKLNRKPPESVLHLRTKMQIVSIRKFVEMYEDNKIMENIYPPPRIYNRDLIEPMLSNPIFCFLHPEGVDSLHRKILLMFMQRVLAIVYVVEFRDVTKQRQSNQMYSVTLKIKYQKYIFFRTSACCCCERLVLRSHYFNTALII